MISNLKLTHHYTCSNVDSKVNYESTAGTSEGRDGNIKW